MSRYQGIKLLLVEDHLALREMLCEALTTMGYEVLAYDSAEAALKDVKIPSCQIALLDVNLPGISGIDLAQQLRKINPVIGLVILTVRNQIADKLVGYEVGADLYLPKPVAPEELDAAIQSLCRRMSHLNQAELTLHYNINQLVNSAQKAILISEEDSRLLVALASAPQQQLEFWEIADCLALNLDSDTVRPNIEKRISRLRQKLSQLNYPTTVIKSVRGYGYQLNVCVRLAYR